jgi:hypothetical protein
VHYSRELKLTTTRRDIDLYRRFVPNNIYCRFFIQHYSQNKAHIARNSSICDAPYRYALEFSSPGDLSGPHNLIMEWRTNPSSLQTKEFNPNVETLGLPEATHPHVGRAPHCLAPLIEFFLARINSISSGTRAVCLVVARGEILPFNFILVIGNREEFPWGDQLNNSEISHSPQLEH